MEEESPDPQARIWGNQLCWSSSPGQSFLSLAWAWALQESLLLSKVQTVKEVFLLKMKQTPKWVILGSPRDCWLLPTCHSLRGSQMMPGRWSRRSTSFPENSYDHISKINLLMMWQKTFPSSTIEHIIDNLLVSKYRVLSSEDSVHCIFWRDIFNLDEIQSTWEGRELLRAPFLSSG